MSANTNQSTSGTNEHDIYKRLDEYRRLIEAGVNPQCFSCMTNPQTNEILPGATIELWIPKKKGTSTLDLHGVRDHVNDLSNDVESRKKQSFFLCLRCTITSFGHSSKPPIRINISSTN